MSSPPPSAPAFNFPCAGGVHVVPYMLPFRIPVEAYEMTVAEYFGLDRAAGSGES